VDTPLVTCIVPHHLDENAGYLKLCLDSILASEGVDFEVICVADTRERPKYPLGANDQRLQLFHDKSLGTASAKVNWAVKRAKGKYLWIISDDVMVSKYAMKTMVEGVAGNPIICNPLSNSDNGSQYWFGSTIPVKLTKEELHLPDNWGRGFFGGAPFLIPVRHFISFYCTMMSHETWDKVGELDERLDCRHNDHDYCLRARKLGIEPMINLGAFALHFGDRTLPKSTMPEQYAAADKAFLDKWAGQ
jgi:GT2 family glycosyltransferase